MRGAAPPSRANEGVSLPTQIACVARELAMRRSVYPGLIKRKRMKAEDAAREILAMQAVLDTLRDLAGTPTAVQPELHI